MEPIQRPAACQSWLQALHSIYLERCGCRLYKETSQCCRRPVLRVYMRQLGGRRPVLLHVSHGGRWPVLPCQSWCTGLSLLNYQKQLYSRLQPHLAGSSLLWSQHQLPKCSRVLLGCSTPHLKRSKSHFARSKPNHNKGSKASTVLFTLYSRPM